MTLSRGGKYLAILLVLFVIFGILLTPLSGIETRPVADLTSFGLPLLSIFLVGLVLDFVSLLLLFSGRDALASILAIVGSAVFFPAFFADRTGNLSSQPAPTGIFYLEWATAVISLVAILFALKVRKESRSHLHDFKRGRGY